MTSTKRKAPAETPLPIDMTGAVARLAEMRDAEAQLAYWTAKVAELRSEVTATLRTLGGNTGKVAGVEVLTWNKINTFRGKDFERERPDLAERYTRPTMVDRLDVESLKAEMPQVYAQFQSRSLRPDWKALATAEKLLADRELPVAGSNDGQVL